MRPPTTRTISRRDCVARFRLVEHRDGEAPAFGRGQAADTCEGMQKLLRIRAGPPLEGPVEQR